MSETITSRAEVPTHNAARYAKQLVSHLGRKLEFTTIGDASSAHFAGGTGTITSRDGVLVLLVEAPDADSLARIQDVFARHLERFGQREGLGVTWIRQ